MEDEAAVSGAAAGDDTAESPSAQVAETLVVAIGASAGGIAALTAFLGAVPPGSGLCLLLAQHMVPGDEPLLAETLARSTGRTVAVAADGLPIRAEHILVIPSGLRPGFRAGRIRLRAPSRASGDPRVDPVDRLFRAVAESFGPRGVGVVLSGTGTDGALGLQAIGGAGGLAMAQEAASAMHAEMPAAAAAFADHVAPPQALATMLLDHDRRRRARLTGAGEAARRRARAVAQLPEVCALLRERTGHDFRHYKASTLVRRLERRMGVLRLDSVQEYLDRLRADAQEPATLFRELLVSVTAFFRDTDAFQVLAERAIAPLLAGRAAGDPLRIWVAGCATGEEAYSVAMAVREAMDTLPEPVPVQIFATDVNDRSLAAARRGVYPASVTGALSPERLARFFTRRGRHVQVTEELRAMCLFSPHNLISDPPFSRLDLICCRNLLIYLGAHLQKKLIPLFHHALKPEGYLFLGASETLAGHAELFRPVDARQRLAQKKPLPGLRLPGREAPRLPAGLPRDGGAPPAWREPAGGTVPAGEAEFGSIAQRILLDEFAPAYAIVSGEGNVVFLGEKVDRFLQPPAGSFSASITRMARRGLGIGLRAALSEAVRTRRTTVREGMAMQGPDGLLPVRLTVQPMPELGHGEGLYMLVFQDMPMAGRRGAGGAVLTPDAEAVIAQLERELIRTREDLERAVQDLEAANEELKASNEELLSMNEELQSSNEELETSKEEVQAANAALAAANADLENLLRSTRIATVFLDREGRVRGFTPAASEIYPIGAQDLGRPLAHLTHRLRNLPPMPGAEALRDEAPVEHEAEAEDGRWFLRRVLPYRGEGEGADGMVVTFLDITRRKADERALREAEERLRLAQEAGGVGTWEWEMGTDRTHWSTGMRPLIGLPPAAPASASAFMERIHPEDRPRVEAALADVAAGRAARFEAEFRILRADDGALRWLAGRGELERGSPDRALRMRGVNIDITERRLAEAGARAALDELQALYDTAPVGLCVFDLDLRFQRINARLAEINGLPPEAHLGRRVRDVLPALADAAEDIARRILATGEPVLDIEITGETPARPGVPRIWSESWFPLRDHGGRLTGIGVVAEEVTERRAADRALAESARRLKLAMGAGGLVAWEIAAATGRIVMEGGLREMFGVAEAEQDGTMAPFAARLHPEDAERVLAEFAAGAVPGGTYRSEFRVLHPDGTVRWLLGVGEGIATPEGPHIVGYNADITARRGAEARLAEREALLSTVMDNVPVAVVVAEAGTGRMLFGNPGVERVFRHPMILSEDAGAYREWEAYHADGRRVEGHEYPLARVLATGAPAQGEYHYACGDGVRRWVSITGAPIRDAEGRLAGAAVVCADIDERRRAAEALAESEARFRQIAETLDDVFWIAEAEPWRMIYTSPAHEAVWGRPPGPPEQDLAARLAAIHPEDRARMAEALTRRAAAEGVDEEYRILLPGGEERWLRDRVMPVTHAAETAPRRVAGLTRDVTQRRRAEEIRRLMVHELDHRVKNTLAVVQSLAQQTHRATAEQPDRFFADFAPRLRALAGAHDLLTREGWRGAPLAEVLERTVAAHAAGTGQVPRLVAEGPRLLLAPGAAVSLSMVFHELATNSAKYGALSAPDGQVALRWEVGGGRLALRWTESGGPKPLQPARRGFGSRLLEGVVVRELSGELKQELPPEGLDCRISLPLTPRLVVQG